LVLARKEVGSQLLHVRARHGLAALNIGLIGGLEKKKKRKEKRKKKRSDQLTKKPGEEERTIAIWVALMPSARERRRRKQNCSFICLQGFFVFLLFWFFVFSRFGAKGIVTVPNGTTTLPL
jgi:hypothetical protein